jgi:hypothetical protein
MMSSLVTKLNEGVLAEEDRQPAKESVAGVTALFEDLNTLRSGLVFDEETNKKAKPHFASAWADAKSAGYSLKELIRHFVETFGEICCGHTWKDLFETSATTT